MNPVSLTINGKTHSLDNVPDDMPLLWAIRDIVGLTGTKFGCGKALCGACTVHMNGSAVRSCSITVAAAADKEITTIEGLSEAGDHPVQLAWMEVNVPQCGYCQTGQIMNAAAFLEKTPNPSDTEIDQAMMGNICRCGTYNRIKQAILVAAEKGGAS